MARTSTAEGAPGLTQDALGKVLVLVLLVPENVKGRVRENVGERGSLKGGRNGKKGELEAPVWRVHNRRQRCGSGSKLMILR